MRRAHPQPELHAVVLRTRPDAAPEARLAERCARLGITVHQPPERTSEVSFVRAVLALDAARHPESSTRVLLDLAFALAGAREPVADGTSVRSGDLTVDLVPLYGWTGSGIARHQGGNAFGENSAVPYRTAEPAPGAPMPYVSAHRLGRTATVPVPVTVEVTGDRLTAVWTDGRRDEFVLGELFDA